MAEILSPLGKKQVPAMKTFTVDDATQEGFSDEVSVNDLEARLDAARREKRDAQNKATPAAKSRIDHLIGLGRATVDVQIENTVFSLRTLKSRELREATNIVIVDGASNADSIFELRVQYLARALYAVDGYPIKQVLNSDDPEVTVEFLNEMDESIVECLYSHYSKLSKENTEKYAIKTDQDVKEVAESLKKSSK